jgi:hypothetical protein
MRFFVNIISEATPIMECTFESLNDARNFFNNILMSGYSLSGDEYEVSLGCYILELEEEFIYETQIIGNKERFDSISNYNNNTISRELIDQRLCLN